MDIQRGDVRGAARPAVVDSRRMGQVALDVPLALGLVLALVAAIVAMFQ